MAGITGSIVEPDHEARISALTALLTEKGVDVPALREKLDVLQSPPPGGPRVTPATGADRTLPGSVPRTPDRFRIDTGGVVSPTTEARQQQAVLEQMKERMTGLELELFFSCRKCTFSRVFFWQETILLLKFNVHEFYWGAAARNACAAFV